MTDQRLSARIFKLGDDIGDGRIIAAEASIDLPARVPLIELGTPTPGSLRDGDGRRVIGMIENMRVTDGYVIGHALIPEELAPSPGVPVLLAPEFDEVTWESRDDKSVGWDGWVMTRGRLRGVVITLSPPDYAVAPAPPEQISAPKPAAPTIEAPPASDSRYGEMEKRAAAAREFASRLPDPPHEVVGLMPLSVRTHFDRDFPELITELQVLRAAFRSVEDLDSALCDCSGSDSVPTNPRTGASMDHHCGCQAVEVMGQLLGDIRNTRHYAEQCDHS